MDSSGTVLHNRCLVCRYVGESCAAAQLFFPVSVLVELLLLRLGCVLCCREMHLPWRHTCQLSQLAWCRCSSCWTGWGSTVTPTSTTNACACQCESERSASSEAAAVTAAAGLLLLWDWGDPTGSNTLPCTCLESVLCFVRVQLVRCFRSRCKHNSRWWGADADCAVGGAVLAYPAGLAGATTLPCLRVSCMVASGAASRSSCTGRQGLSLQWCLPLMRCWAYSTRRAGECMLLLSHPLLLLAVGGETRLKRLITNI